MSTENQPKDEQQILHELMLENQRLLTENNQLLKKINRTNVWSFWIRVAWFLILLGAPFAIYYYLIDPYFTSVGTSMQSFMEGLQNVPGWKQFHSAIKGDI